MRNIITAAALILAFAMGEARAQEPIRIGLIMPLTGNAASAGQQSKAAVELAAEIINSPHPELDSLPLAAAAGLPNLNGAKLEIVTAEQNQLAATYLIQLQGASYVAVWPEKSAAAKLMYPFKGWQ